jgi:hypothetical protein
MFALWLRRAAAYFLRIVLPTSLMSQLIGTLLFGRSSPGGPQRLGLTVSVYCPAVSSQPCPRVMGSPGVTGSCGSKSLTKTQECRYRVAGWV